jgi:hypothetical protein
MGGAGRDVRALAPQSARPVPPTQSPPVARSSGPAAIGNQQLHFWTPPELKPDTRSQDSSPAFAAYRTSQLGRVDAGERNPHVDRDTVNVELRVELPADVRRAAETARRSRNRALTAEHDAAIATREAAKALVRSGLSRRDAAEVLRLSHQRVDQLLRSA